MDVEPSPQQRRNKMGGAGEGAKKKKKKKNRRIRKASGFFPSGNDLSTSKNPFRRSSSLSQQLGNAADKRSQNHGCTPVAGTRQSRAIPTERRSIDGILAAYSNSASSSSSESESEDDSRNRVDPTTHLCFNSTSSNSYGNTCSSSGSSRRSLIGLGDKYRPKHFEDIMGHEINIKALSTAIHKDKVAPLYLFHGPSGTGKTSTATIFAMASNCESAAAWPSNSKPCWSCRGCSRSLFITELCSGSRNSGFERIKTLLQSTALGPKASPGFKVKVFIIEECHLLMAGAWEELLSIVDNWGYGSAVFIMITEDANGVPRAVSSRCQKFSFPKLKDTNIILKLTIIAAKEDIRIESDALRLIATKAEGSLREAENILEQMALIGSKITASMAQQLVGLVPRSKLISLLDTAMSSDAIATARCTKELIALGVQPQALVSQLASIITDILSGASSSVAASFKDGTFSRNQSLLTINRSQMLCHALKILIEAEKQLRSSSDHATWVVAALLEIASNSISNNISTDIVLPKEIISTDENPDISCGRNSTTVNLKKRTDLIHHSRTRTLHFMKGILEQPNISAGNDEDPSAKRLDNADNCMVEKPNWAQVSDMDLVWQNILGRIHSLYLKEFLFQQGKLISLTVSRANAIVHLLLKSQEDKLATEMSEETISKALAAAFGCPVTVNISLQPTQLREMDRLTVSNSKNYVADPSSSGQQTTPFFLLPEQPHSPDGTGIGLKQKASRHTRFQDGKLMFQGHEENMAQSQQIPTFSGIFAQGSRGDESVVQREAFITNLTHDKTCSISSTQLKHRWQLLSSIQQTDVSVEPYSQDLLFENIDTNGKQGTRRNPKKLCRVLSVTREHHHHGESRIVMNRSWSCVDITCRDRTMKMKLKVGKLVETMNSCLLTLLRTPCKDYSSVPANERKN